MWNVTLAKRCFRVRGTQDLETRQQRSSARLVSCRWSTMESSSSDGKRGPDIVLADRGSSKTYRSETPGNSRGPLSESVDLNKMFGLGQTSLGRPKLFRRRTTQPCWWVRISTVLGLRPTPKNPHPLHHLRYRVIQMLTPSCALSSFAASKARHTVTNGGGIPSPFEKQSKLDFAGET